jgi:Kelch motif
VKNNEWHIIKSMNIPKCAFATTTLNGKYIYTFGGYNGKERLNLIERYDYFKDEWTIWELKLPQPFSNGACFSPSLNQIILLGGGYNSGFSLEVLALDVEKKTWSKHPRMSEGKDLRNKVVYLNDCIYAIGGNNFRSERFSFRKTMWENLKSYGFLVPDNLDSWSCALSFDQEDNDDIEENIDRSIFDENASEDLNNPYSDSGEINQNEEFDF